VDIGATLKPSAKMAQAMHWCARRSSALCQDRFREIRRVGQSMWGRRQRAEGRDICRGRKRGRLGFEPAYAEVDLVNRESAGWRRSAEEVE
jgi:hypothetical protein